MAQIYTVTNAKGGCGKTTVALNLCRLLCQGGIPNPCYRPRPAGEP